MRHRAYSLPLILIVVALLATSLSILMTTVVTSSTTATRLFRRTQAGYAIRGAARAAAAAAGDALLQRPSQPAVLPASPAARSAAIAAHLQGLATEVNVELAALKPSLTPAAFILDSVAIDGLQERRSGPIQEGAFRGMNGLIQPFDLVVLGHHEEMESGSYIRIATTVERVFIPMFQFFAFIDGYAFVFNGPGATYAGRIHSNGNMCIGSGDPSYFEKLTSAGRIYKLRGSGCRTENSGGIDARSVFVSRAPLANGAATYATPGFESGFSLLFDKDADSSDWLTAAALWNGQIADATHGVPILRAPIRGTPLVQQGRNAVHALTSNTRNSRFLIDPLIPGEPDDVRQQKVAFKADLRILDGVWYLRDPARPAELGTPIWSDHPGQARTTTDTERWANPTQDVGQGDLFGTGARPTRYSHYRTIPGSISLDTVVGGSAVISYGVVHRAGGLTVPGHQRTTPISVCSENAPCFPTHASSTPAQFLQGTRGGFRSAWDESGATDGAADCGADREASLGLGDIDARQSPLFNMLPINFDVAAFQQALQDTDANELGGRLVARGEPFNGAVWIGSTWPGFRVGFGNDAASGPARFWPFQGQQDDDRSGAGGTVADSTNQPFDGLETAVRTRAAVYQGPTDFAVSSPTTKENRPYQRALPQPLCTDSGPAVDLVLASYDAPSTFDGAGSTRQFFAPSCSDSADGHLNSRPNAVRLINAAVLDRSILPKGLSVVTNLPMFLLGDVNTSSVPADRPGERHAGWTPLMVGGDTIGLLSNAWSDAQAPWNVPVRMYWPTRDAASTQYHGAFLYGWAEAALGPSGGCREELSYSMRLHEHWDRGASLPRARIVRGSIFVGWNAVYGTAFSNVHEADGSGAWHDGNGRTKIYSYDHHLDAIDNQPPAAPQFQLTNVLRQFSN